MRNFLLLSLILISSSSLAWECHPYDKYSQPIEQHLEMASDVLVGTVIEGKLDDPLSQESGITLKLKITLPVKGLQSNEIELLAGSSSPDPSFSIGGNYVVFLYGSKKIDFCSMVLELWTPVTSKEELIEYSKRKDIEGIEKIISIANYVNKNP